MKSNLPVKNIVIIGCGAVLELCHRKALEVAAERFGIRVAGLVDSNSSRLKKAQSWFPEAKTFTDVDQCYKSVKDVLLTVVTSPPPFHAAHTEAAFIHESHVLCEKPLAGSVADVDRIVAAANRYGRVLALGMTRRYYPCFVETRRRIMNGSLGDRLSFTYREGGVYGWQVASAAPFRRESSGGGVLLDKGVHALDSLGYLFGAGKIQSNADDGPAESVEANTYTELNFELASGIMQLSWDMNLSNGLHIRGSKGEIWIPIGPLDLLFSRDNPREEWRRETVRVEWPLDLQKQNGKKGCPRDYIECFMFQLVQALRAIELGEKPAATGEDGVMTFRLIDRAYSLAVPLEKPWQSAAEQAAERQHHWRKSLV
jgi:predicted dehydrogenase